MIHVIASIRVAPGKLAALEEIYRNFVPKVLTEVGCIQYQPTFDIETDLANQDRDACLVSVIEIWESKAAFLGHIKEAHTCAFRESIVGIVEEVRVKVLQPIAGTQPGK